METPPWTLTARPPEQLDLGGGLLLRRWQEGDLAASTHAVTSSLAELGDWMPWAANGYTEEDSRGFLERARQQWDAGLEFDYAIVEDGELVGSIGLMTRRGPGVLELGYWLRTDRTGRGLMTRAADALTQVALGLPGVERVAVVHDAGNLRSRGVPERLRFRCVGTEKAESDAARRTGDTSVVWELTASALAPSRGELPAVSDQWSR